jgi:hypothetical protein
LDSEFSIKISDCTEVDAEVFSCFNLCKTNMKSDDLLRPLLAFGAGVAVGAAVGRCWRHLAIAEGPYRHPYDVTSVSNMAAERIHELLADVERRLVNTVDDLMNQQIGCINFEPNAPEDHPCQASESDECFTAGLCNSETTSAGNRFSTSCVQGRRWPGGSRGPDPPASTRTTHEIRANPGTSAGGRALRDGR